MSGTLTHIDWQDGQPVSTMFGDIYFSRESGLEETDHVFIDGNHLHERWQKLVSSSFTIAETGFGTGLNFLSAWRLWQKLAPKNARLHFFSSEKYPLSQQDLAKALALWPELTSFSQLLLAQYRWIIPGWHKLVFEGGRVTLTLAIGDAMDAFSRLAAPVDAWFLDGFAPAKNPEMWQESLFVEMARLSHNHTTFATFTSAGIVRRGLESAGFDVKKIKGYGSKREMLKGQYADASRTRQEASDRRAIVIGGGIAGTSCSHALASRGWQVTLIERQRTIAQGASGNPIGILYPRLSKKEDALERLNLHGYLFTLRLLRHLSLNTDEFCPCGLLQLGFDTQELTKCQAIAARGFPEELLSMVDAAEAGKLAGISLHHAALHFPDAGWISPPALCSALAAHANIVLRTSANIVRLERGDGLWQAFDNGGQVAEAPVVILANANDIPRLGQTRHLPLEPVRGQITLLQSPHENRLKKVVCSDGYVSPGTEEKICVGATFSPKNISPEAIESDNKANLAMLRRMSPEYCLEVMQQSAVSGRAAFRCTSPDYLPLAGQLLDRTQLESAFVRYNADPGSLPWMDGLYISAGFGSKGLTTAPLCAEIIASMICNEPPPGDARLLSSLSPNRFLLRQKGLKLLLSRITYRQI